LHKFIGTREVKSIITELLSHGLISALGSGFIEDISDVINLSIHTGSIGDEDVL